MAIYTHSDSDGQTMTIATLTNEVRFWITGKRRRTDQFILLTPIAIDALIAWLQEHRKQAGLPTTAIGCPNGIEGVVPPEDEKEVE